MLKPPHERAIRRQADLSSVNRQSAQRHSDVVESTNSGRAGRLSKAYRAFKPAKFVLSTTKTRAFNDRSYFALIGAGTAARAAINDHFRGRKSR
jgi:hypothetical protein